MMAMPLHHPLRAIPLHQKDGRQIQPSRLSAQISRHLTIFCILPGMVAMMLLLLPALALATNTAVQRTR